MFDPKNNSRKKIRNTGKDGTMLPKCTKKKIDKGTVRYKRSILPPKKHTQKKTVVLKRKGLKKYSTIQVRPQKKTTLSIVCEAY